MDALIIGLFIFSLGYLLSLARWFYHEWKDEATGRIARPRLVVPSPKVRRRAASANQRTFEGRPISDAV